LVEFGYNETKETLPIAREKIKEKSESYEPPTLVAGRVTIKLKRGHQLQEERHTLI